MTETASSKLKKHMTPKNAKRVARVVVSTSVRFVVTSTIVTLVPTENKAQKAKLYVGAYVISEMVTDKAKDYISNEIDQLVDSVAKLTQAKKDETETDVPNP